MRAGTTSRSELVAVVVDTREQQPYEFDNERVTVQRYALAAGDYSLVGFETQIAIERKSLDDYVTSAVLARERFGRELDKLAGCELGCVVVEGTLDDIVEHRYRAGIHPNAVLGATWAILVDHQVPVFFCSDRQLAVRFVEGLLLRYADRARAAAGEPGATSPGATG